MEFKLGDKVNCKSNTNFGSQATKGAFIVASAYQNPAVGPTGVSGNIYYTVRVGANNYNYNEKDLAITKTQTLHAYTDSTEEVHWSTKKYTDKELTSFGYTVATQFNKTIELE